MRDMLKMLEARGGHSPAQNGYQLTLPELRTMFDMLTAGRCWDAITSAFDYGFVLGRRCEARERKKRASSTARRK